jgi:hypothetical protein
LTACCEGLLPPPPPEDVVEVEVAIATATALLPLLTAFSFSAFLLAGTLREERLDSTTVSPLLPLEAGSTLCGDEGVLGVVEAELGVAVVGVLELGVVVEDDNSPRPLTRSSWS